MAWFGLAATVGWNYVQYRRGKQTICSVTRQALPRLVAAVAIGGVFGVIGVHVWRGYAD